VVFDDELKAEIARRWPAAPPSPEQLPHDADSPLDVYLARAAGRGERWALDALERDVFAPVAERLARSHGRAAADDTLQQVREQLVVAGGLASYAGRGPLKAWVMVIAVRKLLAQRSAPNDSLGGAAALAASDHLELTLLKARYAGVFKQALQRALDSLERRERLVLRMHTVDGLSAEKIGAIFHAHRSTATEWIAKARQKLHERVTEEVRREAGLSSEELQSIGRVLQRHTDFSLPRLLAGRPAEAAP